MLQSPEAVPEQQDGGGATVSVCTVDGDISSGALGRTLVHEHVFTDVRRVRALGALLDSTDGPPLARALGSVGSAPDLVENPYSVVDNCHLSEGDAAVEELAAAKTARVRTVIDPTPEGIGRFPEALRAVARRARLQIVMGCGFYVQDSHPASLEKVPVEVIAGLIADDVEKGVGPGRIRAGIIGEIGIEEFGDGERRVLAAAARAYCEVGVPLYVHLPAWERLGHAVLDVVEEEGGSVQGVVLCHMNPSARDEAYQDELFARGAWLAYDMLGMGGVRYGADLVCPTEEADAEAVLAVAARGWAGRLLVSSDVFLKSMLKKYGGHGYDYVARRFMPIVERLGAPTSLADDLMVRNPRRLFELARLSKGGV